MKHLFFTFSLLFLGLFAFAQPGTRINLTQLEKSPSIDGSRIGMIGLTNANGDQRYAFYVNVGDTCVNYTPTATGNSVVSIFVQKCGTDSIWYVDWEGRSILLAPYGGGGGANDYDWLIIQNSAIPSSINDSIYTYKYASVGARYVWPTAELLVNDSTGASMAVIQGDRNARLALYDGTNQTFSVIDQGGVAPVWYLQDGNNLTFTAASGTPGALTGPYTNHMQIRTSDSTLVFNRYPSSRADTNTVANFLFTDATGTLRSRPVADFPGIGNGIYGGSGTVPDSTDATVTGLLTFTGNDTTEIIETITSGVASTMVYRSLNQLQLDHSDIGGSNEIVVDANGIQLNTVSPDALEIDGNAARYASSYAPYSSLEIPNWAEVKRYADSLNTAGLSGTGTTNYVSKFTGTNTIGNSTIQDDGTNAGVGGTNAQSKWFVNAATTATSGSVYGGLDFLNATPSGASSANMQASRTYMQTNGSNNITGSVSGVQVVVQDNNTGTKGSLFGAGYTVNGAAGNISTMYGQYNDVVAFGGIATATTGYGVFGKVRGSITNAYAGYFQADPHNGITPTNFYGAYVNMTGLTGSTVNGYGFYQNGSGYSNVFQSPFVVGQTTAPDASAILEAESTTKGFLPPRGTETQRDAIASPATGLHFYNTTVQRPQFYNGTTWSDMGTGTVTGSGTTNYVAKFTSSTSIGDGYLFDNGTKRIGINTTSPVGLPGFSGAALDVVDLSTNTPSVKLQSTGVTGGFGLDNGRIYYYSTNGIRQRYNASGTGASGLFRVSTNKSGSDIVVLEGNTTGDSWAVGLNAGFEGNVALKVLSAGTGSGYHGLKIDDSAGSALFNVRADKKATIGSDNYNAALTIAGDLQANNGELRSVGDGSAIASDTAAALVLQNNGTGSTWTFESNDNDNLYLYTGTTEVLQMSTLFKTTKGRFASESSSTPTVTYGAGAGTSPSTTGLTGGFNSVVYTFQTGTSPTTDGAIFTMTLPANMPSNVVASWVPANAQTATDLNKFYCSGSSANSFTVQANGTLSASTFYAFRIVILGY